MALDFQQLFQTGPKRYIFSIFPFEMRATRNYIGQSHFVLPAAKSQTDVQVLEVGTALENREFGDQSVTTPIFADAVARCLVNEWTNGMIGQESGASPGIWIGDKPSMDDSDYRAARARQEALFRWFVNSAHELYQTGRRNEIGAIHRAAAKWLGVENVPWLEELKQEVLAECPHCVTRIPARATVCPNCHRDIEHPGVQRQAKK